MNLRTVLDANGYTVNDLWNKMQAAGCPIARSALTKMSYAHTPGASPNWNVVLYCLDDMGVDW